MIVISVTQLAVHHKRKPSPWLPLNWVEARLLKPHERQKSLFFPGALESGNGLPWQKASGPLTFFPACRRSRPARRGKEIRPNTNQTSAFYLLRLGPVMRAGSRQRKPKIQRAWPAHGLSSCDYRSSTTTARRKEQSWRRAECTEARLSRAFNTLSSCHLLFFFAPRVNDWLINLFIGDANKVITTAGSYTSASSATHLVCVISIALFKPDFISACSFVF